MTPSKRHEVLFGGTFDPIHNGHLDLIRRVGAELKPDCFWVCPAKKNPLKTAEATARPEDRLEMARRALAEVKDVPVKLLEFEVKASGPSYTWDTVQHLKGKGAGELTLVMGNEVFGTLPRWHEPRRILESTNVVVVTRDESETSHLEEVLLPLGGRFTAVEGERWHHSFGHWIWSFPLEALPFSATALREAIRRYGQRPEGLPDGVWSWIQERHLYSDKE